MRRSRTSSSEVRRAWWLVGCGLFACASNPVVPAPRCPVQPVVLASPTDVARLAGCPTAAGVTIRSGAPLDVSSLHALATITGDLVIGPTVAIEDITLRELRVVDGAIRVASNSLLQGLFLPRLERAGRIEIDRNVAMTTVSLPRLRTAHALHVTGNANLELIDVSALVAIDRELVIAGGPSLTLLEVEQLQRAAAVRIEAPKLPPELADRLRAVAAPP